MITTSQTLVDGTVNVVVQINGLCDDGLNETGVVKVDVSELDGAPARVKLCKITGAVNYGVVMLSWSDTPDRPFLILENTVDFCYHKFGGLGNTEASGNGDIILTTSGFDVNSNYSLLLEMEKR